MSASYRLERGSAVLHHTVAVVCCAYVLMYAVVAGLRLSYPFDLEWMEGGSVDHVRRLLAGERIYGPPTLAFVPYLYPPFYYYVCAAVAMVTGVGLLPLRIVSVLASAGCLVVIFSLVRRETASVRAGVIAAGTFAATYRIGGAWLDLARVDSLFLLLMLSGLYLLRFGTSFRSWMIAGLFIAFGALTKQTGLMMALPLFLYAVIADWRRGLGSAAVCAAAFGGSTWILDLAHEGWYGFYVFGLPLGIKQAATHPAPFWRRDILGAMPIAALLAFACLLLRRPVRGQRLLFYALFGAAFVGSAWASRLHVGAYDNVLLPAYVWLSVLFALGTHALLKELPETRGSLLRLLVAALCLLQLYLLKYDPLSQLPSPGDVRRQEYLIRLMAEAEGEVLLAQHGFFPSLAGKQPNAHSWAILDVLRAGGDSRDVLADEITTALHSRRFDLIVLDHVDPWLEPELSRHYRRTTSLLDVKGLSTVTGYRTRPRAVYVPNGPSSRTTVGDDHHPR